MADASDSAGAGAPKMSRGQNRACSTEKSNVAQRKILVVRPALIENSVMRHFVSLLLVGLTLFLGCSKPSTPIPTRERWAWSQEAQGPGSAEPFEIDVSLYPCQCQGDIGPVPDRSPVAYPHTGIPLIPCTTEEDCQAEKGCRHATCRTDCGFCVFLGYPPCSLDTCTEPGHHTTCATPEDCVDAPYYGVECIEGKCLILPPPASNFYCAAPGDLRPNGQ